MANLFSLLKYCSQTERNGQKLYWYRADLDQLPLRAGEEISSLGMLTDEEFRQATIRVRDFKNGFFDTAVEEENQQYLDVMDAVANGWFELKFIERFWRRTTKHYVEWCEYFLEDGRRTRFSGTKTHEANNATTSQPNALPGATIPLPY